MIEAITTIEFICPYCRQVVKVTLNRNNHTTTIKNESGLGGYGSEPVTLVTTQCPKCDYPVHSIRL